MQRNDAVTPVPGEVSGLKALESGDIARAVNDMGIGTTMTSRAVEGEASKGKAKALVTGKILTAQGLRLLIDDATKAEVGALEKVAASTSKRIAALIQAFNGLPFTTGLDVFKQAALRAKPGKEIPKALEKTPLEWKPDESAYIRISEAKQVFAAKELAAYQPEPIWGWQRVVDNARRALEYKGMAATGKQIIPSDVLPTWQQACDTHGDPDSTAEVKAQAKAVIDSISSKVKADTKADKRSAKVGKEALKHLTPADAAAFANGKITENAQAVVAQVSASVADEEGRAMAAKSYEFLATKMERVAEACAYIKQSPEGSVPDNVRDAVSNMIEALAVIAEQYKVSTAAIETQAAEVAAVQRTGTDG